MKKVGAVTIGQAPRTDILCDVEAILGVEIELIQDGALAMTWLVVVYTSWVSR